MPNIGPEQIEHRFGFHKATVEGENATLPKHRDTRLAFRAFAEQLDELLPDGREKSLAFTALQEASMWTHCAIAMAAPVVDEGPAQHPASAPHSRACGIVKHEHGTACHSNCPTCGGMAAR